MPGGVAGEQLTLPPMPIILTAQSGGGITLYQVAA